MCSKFRILEGSKFGFSRFGPESGPFLAKQVRSSGFLEEFDVQFWWTNLGSKEFKVQTVKFEAVRSSLYIVIYITLYIVQYFVLN